MGRGVIRYIDIAYSSTLALYSLQHTNPMSCNISNVVFDKVQREFYSVNESNEHGLRGGYTSTI